MPSYANRWVVVSGVRDLAAESVVTVREKMEAIVATQPAGIIFGGARGVDTGALRFAKAARPLGAPPKFVVIVPGTARQQPRACAAAIRECADTLIELRLPLDQPSSYHKRNETMLLDARERMWFAFPGPILVAFAAAGHVGGTRATIEKAQKLEIEVEEVPVHLATAGVD